MTKPFGIAFSALMFATSMLPVRGAEKAAAAPIAVPAGTRVPVLNPAPAAGASVAPAVPAQNPDPGPGAVDPKKRFHRPAPLKRLIFSAREGFSLRMVSSQEVTAEIRNGAGRTLARGAYTLEAGDWTLRPRNLAPGLYTVLLRTGPQLRALRMKIEDSERDKGAPEWVLERAKDSSATDDPSPLQGASVFPSPD
jgi:hypothetical protein